MNTVIGGQASSNVGGKMSSYKKAEIIESIIFFVVMVIILIVVVVMYFTKKGLFGTYVRPPLKGQNGLSQPLGDVNGTTNATPPVKPGPGVVALLGFPVEMTNDERSAVKAKVSYEIPAWDSIRKAESQSTTPSKLATGISGISDELLMVFAR